MALRYLSILKSAYQVSCGSLRGEKQLERAGNALLVREQGLLRNRSSGPGPGG